MSCQTCFQEQSWIESIKAQLKAIFNRIVKHPYFKWIVIGVLAIIAIPIVLKMLKR